MSGSYCYCLRSIVTKNWLDLVQMTPSAAPLLSSSHSAALECKPETSYIHVHSLIGPITSS
jgi:hypothetical protein